MGTLFNFHPSGSAQNSSAGSDRKPAVSGKFYPASEKELKTTLKTLFSKAKPRSGGNVLGIICPHAGYVFSGEVAASGYNQVNPDKQYDNVFIVASSHQIFFDGASVYNKGNYVTPLGTVKVNLELANKLIKENPVFTYNPDADKTEHSIEVQVPFLQYHLKKDFNLVPIVIGTQSKEICKQIAAALKPYFNERNLFVFSTDFSHYPSYSDAKIADKATCDAIASGSSDKLLKVLDDYNKKDIPNLSTNLCGWTSILTLLDMVGEEKTIKITPVHYMNSGDSGYGEKSQVVGYWSLAISCESNSFSFTNQEKITLLDIARKTIENYLSENKIPEDDSSDYSGNLTMKAGAFVTLKKYGELRGCIGRFTADIPIYKLIRQMAVASATQDNRFERVTLKELPYLDIEISVLSPMKKIATSAEIIPGKHGIYMKKGYSSGTFLPQVATENGWNTEEFLGYCARDKAGVGWDGWKSAELFIYEACIFSEHELNVRKD
ncbi:MAG: AmmeMemoRadiSam system protein B [Bacteroidota bacterium]